MTRPVASNREKVVDENEFIVSKTDTKGKIIYGNKYFTAISGYNENELLGAPHSILRHPDMPKIIFYLLWERIKKKQEIFAYVKNLCKDGSYYWVFANVTATLDKDGSIRDFHSVRRKPTSKAIETMEELYAKLLAEESSKGVQASFDLLDTILNEKGVDYDTFVLSLNQ